jgi:hypothetical protein
MVPLFALSCFIALKWYTVSRVVEPVKEIYEAFVIYTFFALLTYLLGGERNIVLITGGRIPVTHPPPFNKVFDDVDISDPFTLLSIKRGILQYVWLKPLICIITGLIELFDLDNVLGINPYLVINLVYNISVSLSLYELALFWKCMYTDLKPFNPWGKFLCVKLIIFASYWQGVILGILSWLNILGSSDGRNGMGFALQNALLCVELIGFAIGHLHSFSWRPYTAYELSGCARLTYMAALKDVFGCGDLIYDFRATFHGDDYDYRHFDSVEALIAHPASKSRMARFNDGLRFTDQGKQKYWLPNTKNLASIKTPLLQKPRAGSITSTNTSTRAIYANSMLTVNSREEEEHTLEEDEFLDEYVIDDELYRRVKRERPFGDKNYPVVYDTEAHSHSPALQRLRREAMSRQGA